MDKQKLIVNVIELQNELINEATKLASRPPMPPWSAMQQHGGFQGNPPGAGEARSEFGYGSPQPQDNPSVDLLKKYAALRLKEIFNDVTE